MGMLRCFNRVARSSRIGFAPQSIYCGPALADGTQERDLKRKGQTASGSFRAPTAKMTAKQSDKAVKVEVGK